MAGRIPPPGTVCYTTYQVPIRLAKCYALLQHTRTNRMSMLKQRNSFFPTSFLLLLLLLSSSEREAAVAILARFVDGYNAFAFSVIAFLASRGRRMHKDPVSGTAVVMPFQREAIIMVGELPP